MAFTSAPVIEKKEGGTLFSSAVREVSIEKIGIQAGLITSAALITYFLVMNYFYFMNSAIAWGMNFIILWAGINLSYRFYRTKTMLNVEYFPGLILGGITTAASIIPYVIFVYIWFSNSDAALMSILKSNNLFMGENITPMKAAGSTMIEGICSGVIISFMMMQYFKSGFRRRKEKTTPG